MHNEIQNNNQELFLDIRRLIEDARAAVSQTINVGLTLMFWNVGKRINEEVLKQERAEYGKAIVATLSRQLTEEYGKGYTEKSLRRMIQFHECFPDLEIVATLSRQLSWSHFVEIIPLKTALLHESPTSGACCGIGGSRDDGGRGPIRILTGGAKNKPVGVNLSCET